MAKIEKASYTTLVMKRNWTLRKPLNLMKIVVVTKIVLKAGVRKMCLIMMNFMEPKTIAFSLTLYTGKNIVQILYLNFINKR